MLRLYKFIAGFCLFTFAGLAHSLPDFTEVVEQVKTSVVVISTEVEMRGRKATGPSGSGFVIDSDGYILTNRHVIDGVSKVYVRLINNRVYQAQVLGDDRGTDIALLKIEADDLQAVKLGNVDQLKVGAWVLAFGAPLGLDQSVTAGIVSAKGRSLGGYEQYVPFIQTDAAVNRGNSGGPLFNDRGEVVGINSQIFSLSGGNIGLAFAIPMDLAKEVADQLRENGKVDRGFLGVNYGSVDFDLAQALGLDEVAGAVITGVAADSPAADAGIQEGDVVLSIDDQPVKVRGDLPYYVGRIKPGTEVEIVVYRNGDRETLDVTIGDLPQSQTASSQRQRDNQGNNRLGLMVAPLDQDMRESTGIDYGVVVRQVMPGIAEDEGIRQGDVIQMLNQKRITSVADFNSAIDEMPASGNIAVLVFRPGVGPRFLVLRLEP